VTQSSQFLIVVAGRGCREHWPMGRPSRFQVGDPTRYSREYV
jgi:hypothetical protein